MARKKTTRKDLLKGSDEFMTLTERAVDFARRNARALTYTGIALAAAAVVYLGAITYLGYVEERAQEAYSSAYHALRSGGEPLPADLFEKVTTEHRLARVSKLALPQAARMKFREGRYDRAMDLYREFRSEMAGEPQYRHMTGLALAACHEAKGDYEEAIEALDPIAGDPKSFLREQALLQLARLHGLNRSPDKAGRVLETLSTEFPDSPFLPFARASVH